MQLILITLLVIVGWVIYETWNKYFKDINSPDITKEIKGNPVITLEDKDNYAEELETKGYSIFNTKRDIILTNEETIGKDKIIVVDKIPEINKGDIILLVVGYNEKKGDRIMIYKVKTKHKNGPFTVIRDNDKRKIGKERIKGKVVYIQK